MDFHLQNVLTGETVKLASDRTLIGTAEHATIHTKGGPYLAALAVRYPSGWVVFGLCDDPTVTYNRQPLRAGDRIRPKKGDLLIIGEERFTFLRPRSEPDEPAPVEYDPPPGCFAYVQYPDGKEECRALDHDLLFGRLAFCHVQLADSRLSRLNAMLACDRGEWYVHNLTKKVIGRNRKPVPTFARIEDGDELLIGPLVVRVEIRSPANDVALPTPPPFAASESTLSIRRPAELPMEGGFSTGTDVSEATDDGTGEKPALPNIAVIRENAQRLEQWLKAHPPAETQQKGGLSGWLESQRDRLRRFWYDTPETTNARSLRTAGRPEEAFNVLDRAIRARPDSPELLRELYRLYESLCFYDLCYRPLRQIEKLSEGKPDPWVLETLANVCEKLGQDRPSMIERSIAYWTKLETVTGTSRTREKNNVLARRALREGGYSTSGTGSDGGF